MGTTPVVRLVISFAYAIFKFVLPMHVHNVESIICIRIKTTARKYLSKFS